jgi:hypothetical protein
VYGGFLPLKKLFHACWLPDKNTQQQYSVYCMINNELVIDQK